jgi:uncharacterized protein YbjT (DUF2867 family)
VARVAVAGASGFVGRNLVRVLSQKHQVCALSRAPKRASHGNIEWRSADLFSAQSTVQALAGAKVAIYLIHSMMPSSRLFQGTFHDTDILLADNFATACRESGVEQIIYLGGLIPDGYISPHLESRREVEGVLRSSGIPVTVLRAGMVVGPGGSSFEILRSLVQKLPVLVLPKWTKSKTQVIFIDDVVQTIDTAMLNRAFIGKTFDVVNGEFLTYEDILKITSEILGLKRMFLPVPINSTGFSKLWVQIFGNSSYELVSPLIDSLLCDLPQLQPVKEIAQIIKFRRFHDMVSKTLDLDKASRSPRPRRQLQQEDSVRSIQRLPAIKRDTHWIAMEYMRWLPEFLPALIRVTSDLQTNRVQFKLTFWPQPLLVLEYIRESFDLDREKFHIVGGLLSKTTNTGWLEFRQIDQRRYTLASIHEFVPSLPWPLYVATQAQVHRFTMYMFGRHLARIA